VLVLDDWIRSITITITITSESKSESESERECAHLIRRDSAA
jgi:hypothetical protein